MECAFVVPCYNEASRWHPDRWAALLRLDGIHWVFVDDGSTDGTAAMIRESFQEGSAELVTLARNGGKAEAVRAGLLRALESGHGRTSVGYIDADGAFAVSDVERIVGIHHQHVTAGDVDATWAARVALAGRKIKRSHARHYVGRLVATLVSLGDPTIPYDTQCGLKLFVSGPELRTCLATPFETRWLFEVELLARWRAATRRRMRVWEEPVHEWSEVPGSRIDAREAVRIARELFVVMRRQRETRRVSGDGP